MQTDDKKCKIKYISDILFSIVHELGHAFCIIYKSKKLGIFDASEFIFIAFGDYKNGKLLYCKTISCCIVCLFNFPCLSKAPNPITLSSYYLDFNYKEIAACAKAGWRAELIDLIFLTIPFVISFYNCLTSDSTYAIPIIFAVLVFIRLIYFMNNFKKIVNSKGELEYTEDVKISKQPYSFEYAKTLNKYYDLLSRLSV